MQPGYEHLQTLIEAPKQEALALMKDRFPVPRYVQTFHGESQGRFLLSKLNPSGGNTTAMQNGAGALGGYNPYQQQQQQQQMGQGQGDLALLTDDVSLQVFIDYLKKLAVSSATH